MQGEKKLLPARILRGHWSTHVCLGAKKTYNCCSGSSLLRENSTSFNLFCFTNTTFKCLGQVAIPLATPLGIPPFDVALDVEPGDIAPLLGTNVLDKESLTPDTVAHHLTNRIYVCFDDESHLYHDEWNMPLFCS